MTLATRALTVVAPIDGSVPDLAALLSQIHDDLTGNPILRPQDLPDTHFTRFVIVEDERRELEPLLVWESNYDGKLDEYAIACARTCGPGLARIFERCRDFPGTDDVEAFAAWVGKHQVRADAFYCAYPGVPRQQVVNDRAIHDAIRAYLDEHRARLVGCTPQQIQAELRAHVATLPLDASVQGEGGVGRSLAKVAAIGAAGLIVLFTWPLLLYFWYVLIPRHEAVDVPDPVDAPVHGKEEHIVEEDKIAQNQLTHLVDLKPGWFRAFVCRTVLTVVDVLARLWFVHGNLGGITTIHFARWVFLKDPQGRRHRLLFFSNYDGSWDAYLGEFVDRAARGLTGVWSNTQGFPRTQHLLEQGARDEEAFKQWARDHQILTNVWWSGVPDASVQNVIDDVWIRRRLGRTLDDEELAQWLVRL